jgi:predicted methyltransferase
VSGSRVRAGALLAGLLVLGMQPVHAQTHPGGKAAASQAHEAMPGIDCPLRKAGIDPTKLKPFAEVEKYIRFLERPDRAKWQKPDEVVKALTLKGSETVVDLGAGSGYFTFRLSKALPRGKVVAMDSQPEMVRHIHHKARTEGFANVEARVAKPDDPGLPQGVDLVFVCDVLMHVKHRADWLKAIHSEMPSGARLVLIDFREGKLPQGPPEKVKVPKAEVIRLCKAAGFTLKAERPDLLPYQEFLVFQRP